ncbi:MAG: hypothetical protein ABIR47_16460 [Candidatus Kapaibacterium sp.]
MSSVRLLLFLIGLLLATGVARAAEVLDASWREHDLIIRFSDSTGYSIDLAQSDSVQLVVHILGVTLPANGAGEFRMQSGPLNAVLAQGQGQEIRLTIQSPSRFGYVTLWRPYSKTLVVHTFDWNGLDYAQEQYYKGLLAFEQHIDKEGLDLLQVAHATGESRASSVLGVYYARHGDLKRAEQYLSQPQNADDYAAKAAVQRHNGDLDGAASSQNLFDAEMLTHNSNLAASGSNRNTERMDGSREENGSGSHEGGSRGRSTPNEYIHEYQRPGLSEERWVYIAIGTILLFGLVSLVVWLARRGKNKAQTPQVGERITFPESKSAGGRPVETKPVEAKPVPATPPVTVVKTEVVRADPPPDIYAAHKARKAVKTTTESPAVISPIAEEPPKAESMPAPETAPIPLTIPEPENPPIAQTAPVAETAPVAQTTPIAEPAPIAQTTPIAETAPNAEPAPEPIVTEPRQSNPVPLQAAEIRRRIEAMRTPPAKPARSEEESLSGKATIAEARRLNLSRDTVELRRRMEESGEGE